MIQAGTHDPPKRTWKKCCARRGLRKKWATDAAGVWASVVVHHSHSGAVAYGVAYGPNHSRNAQFMSAVSMAIHSTLEAVPGDLDLTLVYCSQQGHVDISINLHIWEGMGWITNGNEPLQGTNTLQLISKLLSEREVQVRWRPVTRSQSIIQNSWKCFT